MRQHRRGAVRGSQVTATDNSAHATTPHKDRRRQRRRRRRTHRQHRNRHANTSQLVAAIYQGPRDANSPQTKADTRGSIPHKTAGTARSAQAESARAFNTWAHNINLLLLMFRPRAEDAERSTWTAAGIPGGQRRSAGGICVQHPAVLHTQRSIIEP